MRRSLLLLVFLSRAEGENPANCSANYPPCDRHAELLRQQHMDLGVRFATENSVLAEQFRRALDMWATILDLDWHGDNTRSCAIQLMDGQRDLFPIRAIAARAQFPDRLDFQGWIAFNPGQQAHMPRIDHPQLG